MWLWSYLIPRLVRPKVDIIANDMTPEISRIMSEVRRR